MVDNVNGLNALPIGATANNIPSHIQLLKDDLNGGSIIRRLTGAAIAALSAPEKVAGVVVYNTTTGTLQVYNGSAFVDLDAAALAAAAAAQATAGAALPKAGGTMSGAIAMGGSKVTGLAAGSASGDAVRYEQLQDAASRFTAGSINTAAAITATAITPPAGKVLSRVVVSVSGTSMLFLAAHGYQQVVVGAEIQTPATGAVNILRQGVGSGASTTALTIYVDYVAYFV